MTVLCNQVISGGVENIGSWKCVFIFHFLKKSKLFMIQPNTIVIKLLLVLLSVQLLLHNHIYIYIYMLGQKYLPHCKLSLEWCK